MATEEANIAIDEDQTAEPRAGKKEEPLVAELPFEPEPLVTEKVAPSTTKSTAIRGTQKWSSYQLQNLGKLGQVKRKQAKRSNCLRACVSSSKEQKRGKGKIDEKLFEDPRKKEKTETKD